MDEQLDIKEKLLPKIALMTPQHQRQPIGGRSHTAAKSGGSDMARRAASPVGCGRTNNLRLAAWLISISSFMWGFSTAVLNVCIVPDAIGSILVDINLTTEEQERATALVVVGCVLSAVTTGGVGARLGQKKTILGNNVLYIVGSAVCALATSKRTLYAGRLLVGLASGVVTNTVPILLNEISPAATRGEITSLHQLSLTIGMLISAVLGFFIISNVPSGWRYLNGFMILPPMVQCLSMSLVPESPWWLMKNRGRDECRATLVFLRPTNQKSVIETEVQEIARVMEHRQHEPHVTWSHLLAHKKIMVTGTILVFFQAMTGINTVMLYSAKIFHFAGVTNPFFATAVVGFTNVGVTIISVRFVDSYGRRPLLIVGTTIMIIALGVLSWSLLYLNSNLEMQGIVAVISVLLFVGGFAVGLGAVVWVMLGDITPVHIRSRAFSFYMVVSYICNILIAVYTLSAISFLGRGSNPEKNGIAKLYLILGGVAAVCLAYIYGFVEETSHIKTAPAKVSDDQISLLDDEENAALDEELGIPRQMTDL
ncbi:Major Facilitator Superfamily (MFS) transporter [Phytophthora megakarya]|uniref:Hexose transporter 1 n=1 Tax=Phytophthora megakarya TaxID=4795 RepID=A0A225X1R6_9STRA|nr:Major Facilitator Superfamily (MFS) transporter [Phytophthora megakarya]